MLVSAHSLIRSDLLSLNPILFTFNFPIHFFSYDNYREFYESTDFWCTTLITLNIQIRAKGWLNKLLPLLVIFVCFRPMPLHDSLLAKRKFERLLCRKTFLFHFQLFLFLFSNEKLSRRF